MISCEEDAKTPPTLEGLINRYRRWVSTKQIHTKTLSSFTAQEALLPTLAIARPDKTWLDKPRYQEKCVCGLDHNVLRCFILNPETRGRPEGYKPHRVGLGKILHAFQSSEVLKKTKKLYKDNNILWTFEMDKAKDRTKSVQPQFASQYRPNTNQIHNTNRIDDTDHSRDYYANTAFHMA
jgi:hypothetical protein